MTPAERIAALEEKISDLRDLIQQWRTVQEAVEQQGTPTRDRLVVQVAGELIATFRWEVNEDNGFATVQLDDGSILPTKIGDWCLWPDVLEFFGVPWTDVRLDGKQV